MSKATYQVTGPGFRGHKRGEQFEANLSEDEARRAIDRGAIRPVKSGDAGKQTREGTKDG
jgi:hypothetical protein